MFRNTTTGEAMNIARTEDGVRMGPGPGYVATSGSRFTSESGGTWEVDAHGSAKLIDVHGTIETYERVAPATPTPEDLQEFAGTYVSDEAETAMVVAVEGGSLVLKRRPDSTMRLTPLYKDAFSGQIGTIVFRRTGKALEFSVVQDRVWDMRFTRRDAAQSTVRD